MYALTEKREYGRIELENRKYKEIETPCIARLCLKEYKNYEITYPEWDIVAVRNLSAGGMLFTFDEELEMDSMIDIKFENLRSKSTMSCEGRIVRTEALSHLSGFCTVIQFTMMSAQNMDGLNRIITKILNKETKRRNFSFNNLVRRVNLVKRGEIVARPFQENVPGHKKEGVKVVKECCSCNKTISERDHALEHCGQLCCQKCAN